MTWSAASGESDIGATGDSRGVSRLAGPPQPLKREDLLSVLQTVLSTEDHEASGQEYFLTLIILAEGTSGTFTGPERKGSFFHFYSGTKGRMTTREDGTNPGLLPGPSPRVLANRTPSASG